MKRFQFPLESVLRLRRFREAEARQALQEAIAELHRAEEELERTRRSIVEATERIRDGLGRLDASALVFAWDDLSRLEDLALKQALIVAEWESTVAERREAYLAAQQERKPIERLKEEMGRAHLHEADLVEQGMNDEQAMIAFSRRGREP